MSQPPGPTRFVASHAAHNDWRVALQRALDTLLHDARVATVHAFERTGETLEFSLGLCYLTDHFAVEAEHILAALQHRLPGVHWAGTVGVGVARKRRRAF